MSDLAATAQRLRKVKQATKDFLALYALDNLKARVESQGKTQQAATAATAATAVAADGDRRLSDYNDHDWSLLYRGSVLDD